jgi:hypothetical protein
MRPRRLGWRDALDAAELMSIGFDKLREHLEPTHRSHRVITQGGDQPNVIPASAKSGGSSGKRRSTGRRRTSRKPGESPRARR